MSSDSKRIVSGTRRTTQFIHQGHFRLSVISGGICGQDIVIPSGLRKWQSGNARKNMSKLFYKRMHTSAPSPPALCSQLSLSLSLTPLSQSLTLPPPHHRLLNTHYDTPPQIVPPLSSPTSPLLPPCNILISARLTSSRS